MRSFFFQNNQKKVRALEVERDGLAHFLQKLMAFVAGYVQMHKQSFQKSIINIDSLDYQMRRIQELNTEEQEVSYQRQLNKEKVHIRKNEREATFNLKRKKFTLSQPLKRESNKKQKEKEENETNASILDPNSEVHENQDSQFIIIDQRYSEQINKANQCEITIDSLNELTVLITSQNTVDIILGAIGIRRLSTLNIDVIQQIVDTELVDVLIQLTDYPESPQVKLEATWSIANIAGGTNAHCETLVSRGIIAKLVDMVNKRELGIMQQAVWAMGNISTDCTQYRNMLLDAGAGEAIIQLVLNSQMGDQLKTECCWTLTNLCRGNPLPEFEKVRYILRMICAMLSMGCIKSEEAFIDSCWALSYHYSVQNNRLKDVVELNPLETLIPIALQTSNCDIIFPILRIIGQISVGNYMDYLVERKSLDLLQKNLQSSKKALRRESTWILSNLAASSSLEHIQMILRNDTIVTNLLDLFENDSQEIRSEIAFIFRNICCGGKSLSLDEIYARTEIPSCYLLLLQSRNPKYVYEALDSVNLILKFSHDKMIQRGSNVNLIAEQLIKKGGAKIIEDLQYHKDDDIYDLANHIVLTYFEVEESQNGIKEFKKKVEKIINSAQHQSNSS